MRLAPALICWQRRHGRHHLPWQMTRAGLGLSTVTVDEGLSVGAGRGASSGDGDVKTPPMRQCREGRQAGGGQPPAGAGVLRDPYRVWLSEVMLQQTQVTTAIPYFERFLAAFPTVSDLAAAESEQVMGLWAGLGYYSRARNLHAAARRVAAAGGVFPSEPADLQALPGVGRSTAAAIAVFGFGRRAAILDGNVKRVLSRVFAIDADPAQAATLRRLWALAEAELPADGAGAADMIAYTQGLMDLGAMVCTRTAPACGRCPLAELCRARAEGQPERYPRPRARKAQPVREVHFLLLRQGDQVLLAARPERGLWGGLWALPELPAAPSADWRLAGGFQHVFTHFRMDARVWMPPVGVALPFVPGAMAEECRRGEVPGEPARCAEPSADSVAGYPGEEFGVAPDRSARASAQALLVAAIPPIVAQRWVSPRRLGGLPLPTPIRNWLERADLQST
ncbi:MAG: A/G-specific adenine glycosylase [Lautropia sp.]|nr:A/G-specific adenine glycosylase [Lautropia sp.]